jgi:hypothetical protein
MNEPATKLLVPADRIEKSGRQVMALPITDESSAVLAVIARAASDPTIDISKMQQLLAMHESMKAKQREQLFIGAMADFKSAPPEILKDRHVRFETSKGVTEYDHASLASVCDAIIAGLSRVNISHRWKIEQNGKIRVTCILTHQAGHSEETALESAADESGGKNSIQAIGSAVTYLSRYTLLAATGLATKDQDDDGVDAELVGPGQVEAIEEKIKDSGLSRAALLEYLCITSPEQILACNFATVLERIEEKRKRVSTTDAATYTAKRMRDAMLLDLGEIAIAETIREMNAELNKDQANFNAAWTLLTSQERTAWKGWMDYQEPNRGNRY